MSMVVLGCVCMILIKRRQRQFWDQNYPNLEYLIVDDGSTDSTRAIIEKYAMTPLDHGARVTWRSRVACDGYFIFCLVCYDRLGIQWIDL